LNEQRGKVKSYLLTNHNQESKVILLLVNEEEKGRQKEILFICLFIYLFYFLEQKEKNDAIIGIGIEIGIEIIER
jgi:hypothetical protein